MQEKRNKLLADFNRLYKEEDELYHKAASKMGVPDSVFSIFISSMNWERDVCKRIFAMQLL